jgi:hypothetical protein
MDSGFIAALDDLTPNDPTHLTAGGYRKTDAVWANAIVRVHAKLDFQSIPEFPIQALQSAVPPPVRTSSA